jgi:acyl-CoA thioesterase YciA
LTTHSRPEADGFELITRRLCLIKDTGHAGVLWGGNMMAWVDEAGAIYAGQRVTNMTLVTKAFTEINFTHSVRPGDAVEFWGKVVRYGTSSIAIKLRVLAVRPPGDESWEVLDVTGIFVAIDEDGNKERIRPRVPGAGV